MPVQRRQLGIDGGCRTRSSLGNQLPQVGDQRGVRGSEFGSKFGSEAENLLIFR